MFFQDLVRDFAPFELRRSNNCLLRESNAEVSVVIVEVATRLFSYLLSGFIYSNPQWRR